MADTSIDMTALSAKHNSTEAAARTRRRHRAETRLRWYGITAIAMAGAALLILLGTVVLKTIGVTHEHYLTLNVSVELKDKDIKKVEDPNPLHIPNLRKVVNTGLSDSLGTKLDRRERKLLRGLLSTDAGYELGKLVKADPSLTGKEIEFAALLDDRVQQYFRGDFGTLRDAGSDGQLTLQPDGDDVAITLSPGAFDGARELLREARLAEAKRIRRAGLDQARAASETQEILAEGVAEAERAELSEALEGYREAAAAAEARVAELEAQASDAAATFKLTSADPSLFIQSGDGWIKLTELGPNTAKAAILDAPKALGTLQPGAWTAFLLSRPEAERKIKDREVIWLENYTASGQIEKRLNTRLLTARDSSNPELAGIWGAMVGSFWTMMVTFFLAFPIGVMAAIYLEEFAPKNRVTAFIEVNINNLAAVPSIVFGLLGLTVLLSGVSLFGVDLFDGILKAFVENPRSTPLVGGVVLALMSLPTIIIAARASIKAVPPSIRDAALGLGASKLQTSTHHVLPLAMPGILTGSIIAMAQALGETAPLILVGMHAFIPPVAESPLEPSSVLPSLIYRWNDLSERLYDGKTAAAISVLLIFLILMNALAVMLRKRFERRW